MNNFCYIHIPFCSSKCNYCRFASFGNLDELKIEMYVSNLIKEIQKNKIQGELSGKDKRGYSGVDFNDLKSIYFGGGTPSVLTIKQLERIINTLREKYIFNENIEITLEATPITITKQNLIGWKEIGINRLSMGLQTLNNESLIEIGRGNKGDIINALNNIKEIGFDNLSVDFIIGLPYVVKGEIKNNIEFILENYTFIKHISVYMLEEYYDLPQEKKSKFDNLVYPNSWINIGLDESEYLDEYIEIKNTLKENKFFSYEISNFAKSGYECKHNKGYWNHSNILAFGLGAHGFINNERYGNSEEFLKYYSGEKEYIEKLYEDDLFLEDIMFSLRTNGLNTKQIEKLNTKKIGEYISDGYLKKCNNDILLTNKGILVLDYILKEILK